MPGSEVIPKDDPTPELTDIVVVGGPIRRPPTTSSPLTPWTTGGGGATTTTTPSPTTPAPTTTTTGTTTKVDAGYTLSTGLKVKWGYDVSLSYGPPLTPASGPREAQLIDGWFEPSQGVWQDDIHFADKAGKRLQKTSDAIRHAELVMVKDRPTLLYGTKTDNYSNATITYRSKMLGRVGSHFRFTLYQPGLPPVIVYEEEPNQRMIYFDAPAAQEWADHEVKCYAYDGLPVPGKGPGGGHYFTFTQKGPYVLVADVIRSDTKEATGLKAVVFGQVVETHAPRTQIMPVVLFPPLNATMRQKVDDDLLAAAERIRVECEQRVPEWFPLKPGSFTMPVRRIRNLSSYVKTFLADRANFTWTKSLGADVDVFGESKTFIPAILGSYFDVIARVGEMSRTVVLINSADFLNLNLVVNRDSFDDASSTLAYAACQKVMFAPDTSVAGTIAHELVHTLPYLWSANEMQSELGLDWHNKFSYVAAGPQIFKSVAGGGVAPSRLRFTASRCIMEINSHRAEWISQGAYWQLAKALQQPPDPPLILVSGMLMRREGRYAATITRLHNVMGIPDLAAAKAEEPVNPEQWAIVAVDRRGNVLARYPFSPDWRHPEGGPDRDILPLSYTVLDDERISEIRVVGPTEVSAARALSFAAPELTITSPANGATVTPEAGGRINVAWRGSAAGGARLVYSVFYSPDGGANWYDQAFEQTETMLSFVPEGGAASPLVRVMASDGSRSRTVTVGFKIAK